MIIHIGFQIVLISLATLCITSAADINLKQDDFESYRSNKLHPVVETNKPTKHQPAQLAGSTNNASVHDSDEDTEDTGENLTEGGKNTKSTAFTKTGNSVANAVSGLDGNAFANAATQGRGKNAISRSFAIGNGSSQSGAYAINGGNSAALSKAKEGNSSTSAFSVGGGNAFAGAVSQTKGDSIASSLALNGGNSRANASAKHGDAKAIAIDDEDEFDTEEQFSDALPVTEDTISDTSPETLLPTTEKMPTSTEPENQTKPSIQGERKMHKEYKTFQSMDDRFKNLHKQSGSSNKMAGPGNTGTNGGAKPMNPPDISNANQMPAQNMNQAGFIPGNGFENGQNRNAAAKPPLNFQNQNGQKSRNGGMMPPVYNQPNPNLSRSSSSSQGYFQSSQSTSSFSSSSFSSSSSAGRM